jgi:cytoskeleton protein RodZ
MPLDTAQVTDELSLLLGNGPHGAGRGALADTYFPSLDSAPSIGAGLRAIREFHGLDIEDLSQATRIRKSYLTAMEDMRLEDLPSRPFVIGYIRAYAKALQLDPEMAVAKFRLDVPEEDTGLREPVGVRRTRDPRLTLFIVAGLFVVAGVAAWNIAQHTSLADITQRFSTPVVPPKAPELPQAGPPQGPVALTAPQPAPQESTTPPPYVTPGLEAATGGAAASGAPATVTAADDATPATFTPKGAVYGAPANQSTVTLQASHAASLVIHGADGQVYFAKELAPGEAYRIPQVAGLSVDVSDPAAFNIFVSGALKGVLPAAKMPASKLAE